MNRIAISPVVHFIWKGNFTKFSVGNNQGHFDRNLMRPAFSSKLGCGGIPTEELASLRPRSDVAYTHRSAFLASRGVKSVGHGGHCKGPVAAPEAFELGIMVYINPTEAFALECGLACGPSLNAQPVAIDGES